jgi:hypothetical protein
MNRTLQDNSACQQRSIDVTEVVEHLEGRPKLWPPGLFP